MGHMETAKGIGAVGLVCAGMAMGVGVVRAQQTPAPARAGWNIPRGDLHRGSESTRSVGSVSRSMILPSRITTESVRRLDEIPLPTHVTD